jgi:hypothetical protein
MQQGPDLLTNFSGEGRVRGTIPPEHDKDPDFLPLAPQFLPRSSPPLMPSLLPRASHPAQRQIPIKPCKVGMPEAGRSQVDGQRASPKSDHASPACNRLALTEIMQKGKP